VARAYDSSPFWHRLVIKMGIRHGSSVPSVLLPLLVGFEPAQGAKEGRVRLPAAEGLGRKKKFVALLVALPVALPVVLAVALAVTLDVALAVALAVALVVALLVVLAVALAPSRGPRVARAFHFFFNAPGCQWSDDRGSIPLWAFSWIELGARDFTPVPLAS